MSESSAPVFTKKGLWFANVKGNLYALDKRGSLRKIKMLFIKDSSGIPIPAKVSSVPGCNFSDRERVRLSCKRVFTGSSHTLVVTLLRVKAFGVTDTLSCYEFFIEDGEFCEIIEDENCFKQTFVKKLTELILGDAPDELPYKFELPDYHFMVPKALCSVGRHQPHQALVLYNDGVHLYAHHGENQEHLSFRRHKQEVSSTELSWMNFLESEVMFKTFGHTRDKSVVVFLREKRNNWTVVFALLKGQTVLIDECMKCIGVRFSK